MNCLLLTGATGLLGRYLLRDFLLDDLPVAVLVRAGRRATAVDRIEAVMAHWEDVEEQTLGRPVVLEGDLNQAGLGLDSSARQWVAANCDAVLHSAASMTFSQNRRGEPFQTNIHGTQCLVHFCRDAGLRRFHHISTAYLCGLRTGRVLESELDLGQPLGNVYEKSKLEAEKLVRAAEHLEEKTFYRPASIVGDSQTGYVTSYHGFYLPLQLAYAISNRIPPEHMNERFLALLGLTGTEGKNFVPVDWVAAVIAYLVTHPEHHGNTYHVAAPQTVSARLFQRVVQDAIQLFSNRPIAQQVIADELLAYERIFHESMQVYRSHWRDDPQFDLTNTRRAAPHLPCPEMDYELLMRVARFPVEHNFTVHKHEEVKPAFNSHEHLARWRSANKAPTGANEIATAGIEPVSLQITGPGGGPWRLGIEAGRVVHVDPGLGGTSSDVIRLNTSTLAALSAGELSLDHSLRAGRVMLHSQYRSQAELRSILTQVVVTT
jgi:thioester reductase-like protein